MNYYFSAAFMPIIPPKLENSEEQKMAKKDLLEKVEYIQNRFEQTKQKLDIKIGFDTPFGVPKLLLQPEVARKSR